MTNNLVRLFLTVFAAGVLFPGLSAQAKGPKLDTTEIMIPSGDPGVELFVRNKHPAGKQTFSSDRFVWFFHGAPSPAETAFDLPIEGSSMMALIAARGYDV